MRHLKKKQINDVEAKEVSKASITKFGLNLKGNFRKFTLLLMILLFLNISSTTPGAMSRDSMTASIPMTKEEIYVATVKTKMKIKLIDEVDSYIYNLAPNSGLSSEYLVEKCLEYDTDIIFVLSQAILESHFGTRGKAASTNSVWNVGTYDDGQILYTYSDPNESLEPYLKLVNDKYLIEVTPKGDTIYKDLHHLVQDRGYTNYNGKRFATARGYENGMRILMVKIDMETSIGFYQDILRLNSDVILSYFAPVNHELDSTSLYALK